MQYVIPPAYSRSRAVEDVTPKMHNFYNQFSGSVEKDRGIIAMDHCYARPLNWTPESAFFQPTKTLFMQPPLNNKRKSTNPLTPSVTTASTADDIDIESPPALAPELYDYAKAMQLMNECEKHAMFGKNGQDDQDWEDSVSKYVLI